MTLAIAVLLAAGFAFHALAALGVIRLPDFYTRLHAVSKAETLGVGLFRWTDAKDRRHLIAYRVAE